MSSGISPPDADNFKAIAPSKRRDKLPKSDGVIPETSYIHPPTEAFALNLCSGLVMSVLLIIKILLASWN